jgi:hypothetical protein
LAGNDPANVHRWKVFRYPSLIEGFDLVSRAAIRRGLLERGYRIATVTIDFADWAYSSPYERCASRRDHRGIAALELEYLTRAVAALKWSDSAASALVGRRIKHVLLLHVSRFTAIMIDELLETLEQHGVRFVSLDEALADPVHMSEPRTPRVFSGDLLTQIRESRPVIAPRTLVQNAELLDTLCR